MKPVNSNDILHRFRLRHAANVLTLGCGLALLPMAAEAQYYGRGYGPYVVSPYGGYGGGRYVVPPDGGGPYGGPYGYDGPPPYGPYDAGPGPYGPPGPAYGEYDPPPRSGPRPLPYDGPSGSPPGPRSQSGPSAIPPAQSGGVGPVSLDMIQARIKAAGYKLIAPPRHKGNIYLAEVEDKKSVRRRLVYDANDGHLLENTPLGPVKKLGEPLPSEAGKVPSEPGPTNGEHSGQARTAPPVDASPQLNPHSDEPPPPATAEPAPTPHSELTDKPAHMAAGEDAVKFDLISLIDPYVAPRVIFCLCGGSTF